MPALVDLLSNERFDLIVLPTGACNFRCTYCYEDFTQGRMRPAVVSALKAFCARRMPSARRFYLSWFGGEPLLAGDVVLDVSAHAARLARAEGASYRSGMTTNGSRLTPSTAAALAEAGVLDYQISLDGPADIHDGRRVRAGGGPTFEAIWGNLRALRGLPHPITVRIRVHFDAASLPHLDPLVDDLRREFLSDPRFSVFFRSLARLGGPRDADIQPVAPQAEREAARRLTERFGRTATTPEPAVCYAARPNSLVILPDGGIAKCTVALADPRNRVGRLREDGSVAIDSGRLAPWVRGIPTSDRAALECPWRGMGA